MTNPEELTPLNPDAESEVKSNQEVDLSEEIGFADSAEMDRLKKQILLVGVESEEFSGLYGKYQEAGEALADTLPGFEGRISLMLKSAKIIAELGLTDDAVEAYNDAAMAAEQAGLDDIATNIYSLIDGLERTEG